ncbi:hypothetical protein AOLI_G00164080 [Acnodon oligacanthus]
MPALCLLLLRQLTGSNEPKAAGPSVELSIGLLIKALLRSNRIVRLRGRLLDWPSPTMGAETVRRSVETSVSPAMLKPVRNRHDKSTASHKAVARSPRVDNGPAWWKALRFS